MASRRDMRASRAVFGLAEVTEMLIAGGYFRAKIASLPEFDKMAGGLAWGILNSRFSIDVEFVENAAIRDKIKIAENICRALKEDMKCPHDLEPYQIQGLDYPKIAIVLQWLLKRVAAAREENAYFVREHTKAEFRRRFGSALPPAAAEPKKEKSLMKPPQRVLRADPNAEYASVAEHANSVLLEYGFKYQMKDSTLMLRNVDAEVLEGDTEMQREQQKAQDDERKETAMLDRLMEGMSDFKDRARMTNANFDAVMANTDSEKLEKLRNVYESRRQELLDTMAAEEAERNALERQKERVGELQEEEAANIARAEELREECAGVSAEQEAAAAAATERADDLEAHEAKLDETEKLLRKDPERAALFDEILSLLEQRVAVKKRLSSDKTDGKARVADAKQECMELVDRIEAAGTDEAEAEFEAEKGRLDEQLTSLEAELAQRDQDAMGVLRQIDEYPTRAELNQYEIRINELNEEVAWKFEGTRLMYNQYNTRAEVSKCLQNEEEIVQKLTTMFDGILGEKKKNATQRIEFLTQIEAITLQLAGSSSKQRVKREGEAEELANKRNEYNELRGKQQAYWDLLETFKKAMAHNEALQQELASVNAEAEVEQEE